MSFQEVASGTGMKLEVIKREDKSRLGKIGTCEDSEVRLGAELLYMSKWEAVGFGGWVG